MIGKMPASIDVGIFIFAGARRPPVQAFDDASLDGSRRLVMRQRWRAVKLSRLNDSKPGMIHVVP
ncbi:MULTISPECIES: hypothetical protein [Azonexaceae]|uniref:hypothetical protein n=1 Tax=Azonexaceae TaxID=2008795 RepID=UPI001CF8754F|nr:MULTISPECIES: hypothetical protein [Azonexaceae]UCV22595.1 hypothetical protein KI613_19120 [Ferribacterium limneticum]